MSVLNTPVGRANGTPAPEPLKVSPLDKHAHLRRTVDEHHQALQVHQTVLQKHAELHQVQANAREALKRDVENAMLVHAREFNVFRRMSFLQRAWWFLTGRFPRE